MLQKVNNKYFTILFNIYTFHSHLLYKKLPRAPLETHEICHSELAKNLYAPMYCLATRFFGHELPLNDITRRTTEQLRFTVTI